MMIALRAQVRATAVRLQQSSRSRCVDDDSAADVASSEPGSRRALWRASQARLSSLRPHPLDWTGTPALPLWSSRRCWPVGIRLIPACILLRSQSPTTSIQLQILGATAFGLHTCTDGISRRGERALTCDANCSDRRAATEVSATTCMK